MSLLLLFPSAAGALTGTIVSQSTMSGALTVFVPPIVVTAGMFDPQLATKAWF